MGPPKQVCLPRATQENGVTDHFVGLGLMGRVAVRVWDSRVEGSIGFRRFRM